MAKSQEKTPRTSKCITLLPEIWERLKQRAENEHRNLNNMVEKTILDALDAHEGSETRETSANMKSARVEKPK